MFSVREERSFKIITYVNFGRKSVKEVGYDDVHWICLLQGRDLFWGP
jgi:hypothetical protein